MATLNLTDAEKAEVLRETYKKHATELLAIEDAQQKITILLLGILGAGGSFIAGMKEALSCGAKCGLTVVVVSTVIIGLILTFFRSHARETTRALLVRCEEALGFGEKGYYIPGEKLYGDVLMMFPSKGKWLGLIYALVPAAGVGFLITLWKL
jgi:hypothetical protein